MQQSRSRGISSFSAKLTKVVRDSHSISNFLQITDRPEMPCAASHTAAELSFGERVRTKLVNGSRVGQVRPVDSCGQVRDLDLSLVNSCNLSRVGQV